MKEVFKARLIFVPFWTRHVFFQRRCDSTIMSTGGSVKQAINGSRSERRSLQDNLQTQDFISPKKERKKNIWLTERRWGRNLSMSFMSMPSSSSNRFLFILMEKAWKTIELSEIARPEWSEYCSGAYPSLSMWGRCFGVPLMCFLWKWLKLSFSGCTSQPAPLQPQRPPPISHTGLAPSLAAQREGHGSDPQPFCVDLACSPSMLTLKLVFYVW